jgi:hypothetical protein
MSSAQNYELQQLYSARADQAIKLGALQEDRRQQVELAQQAIAKYWGADSNIDDPEERSKAIEVQKGVHAQLAMRLSDASIPKIYQNAQRRMENISSAPVRPDPIFVHFQVPVLFHDSVCFC